MTEYYNEAGELIAIECGEVNEAEWMAQTAYQIEEQTT